MSEFLEMGGYAWYVWPSYAATVLVGAGLTIRAVLRNKAARDELAALEAERKGRS